MKFSDPSKQTMAGLRVIFDFATTFNLAFGLLPCPIDRFRLAYPEIMVEVIGTLDG